jgi:hypothetical protein
MSSTAINQPKTTPRLWAGFSVRTGTFVQLSGLAAGAALLEAAAHTSRGIAVALMAAGLLAIYLCSHAIAHVAVGRAVGIRFRAYGVRGTDHPENYPPGVRHLMSILPMWSALTDKESMRNASGRAKAAMFAAGETSTTFFSVLAGACAAHAGLPAGRTVLVAVIVWSLISCVTVAVIPKGDYTKALVALGWRSPSRPKASSPLPERTTGPNRRGPRGSELRIAIVGWSLANILLITVWVASGSGFPWFVFMLVPSALGVASWARQGRREALNR